MKKFQYKIMNYSEIAAINSNRKKDQPVVTWLDRMNELGKGGWEFTGWKPTEHSFLFKREIGEQVSGVRGQVSEGT